MEEVTWITLAIPLRLFFLRLGVGLHPEFWSKMWKFIRPFIKSPFLKGTLKPKSEKNALQIPFLLSWFRYLQGRKSQIWVQVPVAMIKFWLAELTTFGLAYTHEGMEYIKIRQYDPWAKNLNQSIAMKTSFENWVLRMGFCSFVDINFFVMKYHFI